MKQNKTDGRYTTCHDATDGTSEYQTTNTNKSSYSYTESQERKPRATTSEDSYITKLRVIGVIYNEAVKVLNSYHSVKTDQRMKHQLEICSATIIRLQVQAIQLTMAFDKRKTKG